MTRKHLSRRTLLRGLGTAVALPYLDAMTPAFASRRELAQSSGMRLAFAYVPNGVTMQEWTPASVGRDFELTRILQPLASHREHITVLSGLAQINARALRGEPGDHARAAAAYLTGLPPRKTKGLTIPNGASIDQIAARHFEGQTRFSSLELGTEYAASVSDCNAGYCHAHSNTLSWYDEATPLLPEVQPRLLFERLFGASCNGETPAETRQRQQFQRSLLDTVQEDTQRLMYHLGPDDCRKMDEYLSALRDVEKRLERCAAEPPMENGMPRRAGVPSKFSDHLSLMYDLIAIAFQTNSTRVATLTVGREGSCRRYREIGIEVGHHPLSHHQKNPDKIEKITRINEFHMKLFAGFVSKLRNTPDGGASLLDNTIIVYGSCIGDGDRHNHDDLPVLIAGGKSAGFEGGRHIAFPRETPMASLYLSILDRIGVPTEELGDSTRQLGELTGL